MRNREDRERESTRLVSQSENLHAPALNKDCQPIFACDNSCTYRLTAVPRRQRFPPTYGSNDNRCHRLPRDVCD